MDVKILQFGTVEWMGKQGDKMVDVIGLGDDSQMYRWHKGTGKWLLYVIAQ